jgi:hypothetical protein
VTANWMQTLRRLPEVEFFRNRYYVAEKSKFDAMLSDS